MSTYLLGVLFALLSGCLNAAGNILQKGAINRIEARRAEKSFAASFLRSPRWLAGLATGMGLGTVFNLLAQNRIGPALVPGLLSVSLIVLAFASARLLHEHLKPLEWLGILSIVTGIALLAFSHLQVPRLEVDLLSRALQVRLALFSLALLLCWGACWWAARNAADARWPLLAFSAGLPFSLSNLWILPLLMTIGLVFSGRAQPAQVVIFILSCLLLVGTNVLAVRQTQETYRHAPANKAQPMVQLPTQIVPIPIYLFVFQRPILGAAQFLVPAGVVLILAGAFLLSRRRLDEKNGAL